MFTNGPGDLGSIPGRLIPKTKKMVIIFTNPSVWAGYDTRSIFLSGV